MKNLEITLLKHAVLSSKNYHKLLLNLKTINLKKNDYLIKKGEICKFIGFLESGILRSYISKEKLEHNVDLYFPQETVSSYSSFLTQTPSLENIQAISDSKIFILDLTNFNKLINTNRDFLRLSKYISDFFFIKKNKREYALLLHSATERYNILLKSHPQIENLVHQHQIASYLGISHIHLSRIRNLKYIERKNKPKHS